MKQDVILVNVIRDIVAAMRVTGISTDISSGINYQAGRQLQILKSLNDNDNSVSYKDTKYPLIALRLPIREKCGSGFYSIATVPSVIIATLSNGTDDITTRYEDGGSFKSVLYPCYYEFLNRLAQSKSIIGSDPGNFQHQKMDNPGQQPIGEGSSDYVDYIEILGLVLTLNQIQTC